MKRRPLLPLARSPTGTTATPTSCAASSRELQARGHEVARLRAAATAGAATNLLRDHGEAALGAFRDAYPGPARSRLYDLDALDLDAALDGADLVLVHEWNDPRLVARLGEHRARGGGFRLLFHDTHHRAVTDAGGDGALRPRRLRRRARLRRRPPRPLPASAAGPRARGPGTRPPTRASSGRVAGASRDGDLVWIGNWGDDERTRGAARVPARAGAGARPARARSTACAIPTRRVRALADAGHRLRAAGSPNYEVPARLRALPRDGARAAAALRRGAARDPDDPRRSRRSPAASRWSARRGTTRRACSRPGATSSSRATAREMTAAPARAARRRGAARASSAEHGRATILARHTCAHRVDELLAIVARARRPRARHGSRERSRSSARASSRPTGTAPPPTTAASSARSPSAGTASRSTSRTPTSASSTATSPTRRGRASSSTPATRAATRRRARAGARRRRRRQGERRRRLRRAARGARCSSCGAGDARRLLGRRRAGHARRALERDPTTRSARSSRATTSSSPTAAATRSSTRYRALGARDCVPDLQRARPRARTIPVAAGPALRGRPRRSSATACPTARRASRSSSCARPRCCPSARFLLGGNGWDDKPLPANVRYARPRLHARPQRVQLHAAARCSTSAATAWPRTASRRRRASSRPPARRLPDHRRVGGHRARSSSRAARCSSPRSGDEVAELLAALTPARARADRRGGARARARRAHLRAPRGAGRGDPRRRDARAGALA